MSFLKKLTQEFKELKSSFTDEPKTEEPHNEQPHYTQQTGDSQRSAYDTHQQPQYNNQQSYGQQPQYNQQSYGQQPQQQQSYGNQYQPPPPQYPPSSGPPQLPPGWIMQWDANSQRNYYIETATGRTQWEPPATPQSHFSPPPLPPGQSPYGASQDSSRGTGGGYYDQHQYNQQGSQAGAPGYNPHGAPGPYDPGMAGHAGYYPPETAGKKDHSTRNALLAGGAGLAGGALLYNALDDSDDEHKAAATAPPPQSAPGGDNYGGESGYGEPPQPSMEAPLPTHDADGDYVDHSDRESVEEAREDVLDAQEELREASSESDRESAREDLEEAQEEYHEEYEEAYD